MTIRDVLIAGRAKVAAGWCQKHLRSGEAVCAVGAVRHSTEEGSVTELERAVIHALEAQLPQDGRWHHVPHWNDAPGRTQADVLALYDRAIASLKPDPPALFHADEAAFLSRCRAVAKSPEPVTP